MIAAKKVAVIGGGWAGVSSAVALSDAGMQCTLFEAAPILGGRARRVPLVSALGRPLDNGQHLLIGAYKECLALIQRFHPHSTPYQRIPLTLQYADQSLRLQINRYLPAPLHLAWGLLTTSGLSLVEKLNIVRLVRQLQRKSWILPTELRVDEWLHHQSARTKMLFWDPLCLAALNTRSHEASAALFATVLRDSFEFSARDSDFILPRMDLSQLWVEPASKLFSVRLQSPVRAIERSETQWKIGSEFFDGIVIATAPHIAHQLLLPHLENWQDLGGLLAFSFAPIGTAYCTFTKPFALPAPLIALKETSVSLGQWVFHRNIFQPLEDARTELSIVCSGAQAWISQDKKTCITHLYNQLQQQLATALPPLLDAHWIMEKRATFVASPQLRRPVSTLPLPNVVLAGDWTDTNYPGVLEGAVRSGQIAAQNLSLQLTASYTAN